jgi:hypothetical protein
VGDDQVFKGVLRRFLREFLELFFPEFAARLDFGSLELLDRELFKGFPDGVRREPDVLARIRTRGGDPELVVVHVEAQARVPSDFGQRMFEYFALLWLELGLPVFPIVLYLKEGGRIGVEVATYRQEIFEREVLRFRYSTVALAGLDAEEYVEKGPLAVGLSALMRWGRRWDEAQRHAGLIRRVRASGLEEAAQFLLINLIKTYLPIPEGALGRYRRLISRKEYREVQEVELSWAERLREQGREQGREVGREEGHEEGLQEGVVRGKRDTLKRLLAARFGPISPIVEARIAALSSGEELDRCLDRVLTAGSIEDLHLDG